MGLENQFYFETYTEHVKLKESSPGMPGDLLAMGAVALPVSQADSPLPGPADVVAAGILAAATGSALVMAVAENVVEVEVTRERLIERPLTYVTYTKVNPATGDIYSGRTMGYGTPQQIVGARDRGHGALNARGFGSAQVDKALPATNTYANRGADPSYWAIRGREQQLIDAAGGARSDARRTGQPTNSANKIRGVSSNNPQGWIYHQASNAAFGQLAPFTGKHNLMQAV